MALENYRPIQFPEKTEIDNTDVVLIDSSTNGTNKYQLSRLIAQAQAEAQALVDAEATAREEADDALKADLAKSGLSTDAKLTLLDCFRHVAWIDEHGQDYYDALEEALQMGIISISATFNQGSKVFTETDELDDLKPFLTVVGHSIDDSEEVFEYTLSGNLKDSLSTITVKYGNLTTTFNVDVTLLPSGYTAKTYVEADGTQYIASGLYETEMSGKWTRCKVRVPETLPDKAGHIFSSLNVFSPYLRYFPTTSFRRVSFNRFGSQKISYENPSHNYWEYNKDCVIESYKNGDAVYLDEKHIISIDLGTTMSSSNQLYFFTYGGSVSATAFRFYGRLYYYKIFNASNEKVHDFVPCMNSSNVAGLYDLVTGVFCAPAAGTLSTD